MTAPELFDAHAETFDDDLNAALGATGEDKNYFARGRVRWLRHRLSGRGAAVRAVLDYGCGTGSATPFLLEDLGAGSVLGVDVSARSIALARRDWASARAEFSVVTAEPVRRVDLAFCNGVFHHIPVSERAAALRYIRTALEPGGWLAFWENNSWNPGTRLVMSRCAFDRDAELISPLAARRLLRDNGFDVLGTDFLFVFPKPLAALRPIEPWLAGLPLGGQYLTLCRRR